MSTVEVADWLDALPRDSLARSATCNTMSRLILHHLSSAGQSPPPLPKAPSELPYLRKCPRCEEDMSRISRFNLSSSASFTRE